MKRANKEELAAYDRKIRAVRDQISEPKYDLIVSLRELEGADECSPENDAIWKFVSALPQFGRAARDKVWRDTV